MKYEAPELEIKKFELIEDIMAEGLSGNGGSGGSGGGFNPIDDNNYDNGDWDFEDTLSTAIRNILDI